MPDLDMMGGAMPQKPDNHEAAMARADLYKSANYSFKLFKMIQDGQELEGWVQAKITKAADYIASVYHYMEYEMKFNEYGKKLEDSDVYTESVKKQFQQKLTEARVKLEKLKEKNISDLDEGWDDMIAANKKRAAEKGTGKFDVKKTSTGTQYTRKSSTFDDGGKDKDLKAAEKKRKATKEEVDKSKIPAAQRKAKGGDWKVSKADLDKEASKSLTSKAGLDAKKKALGMKESVLDLDAAKRDPRYRTDPAFRAEVDRAEKFAAAFSKPQQGQDLETAKRDPRYRTDPAFRAEVDKAEKFASGFSAAPVKEALKGGQKKLDVDKDGKLEKSDFAKLRAGKDVKEASHQAKTTMKHVDASNASDKVKAAIRKASKDIKPGIKGYGDRAAALKAAGIEDDRLKEGSKPDFLDMDKDGNKKEPMKKAVADKKKNPFAKK